MLSAGDMRSESMKWNFLAQLNPTSAAVNKININKSTNKNINIIDSESSLNQAILRFSQNNN
jgi:hypothetical protein